MKKVIIGAVVVIFCILLVSANGNNTEIKVLFAPSGHKHIIQTEIADQLKQAKKSVKVAMFMFTSKKLADSLISLHKKGVDVKILFDNYWVENLGQAHREAFDSIQKAKIAFKKVKLEQKENKERPKFHHKFCIIDEEIVITGSYNWTTLADEQNYENVVIIKDKKLAKNFIKHFEQIWNNPELTE